jgi:hypothetical protein
MPHAGEGFYRQNVQVAVEIRGGSPTSCFFLALTILSIFPQPQHFFYHSTTNHFAIFESFCLTEAVKYWPDKLDGSGSFQSYFVVFLGLSGSGLIRPTIEGRSNLSRHKTVVPLYADFLSIDMQIEKIAFGGEIHRCHYGGRPCRWTVQRQYRPP